MLRKSKDRRRTNLRHHRRFAGRCGKHRIARDDEHDIGGMEL